MISVAIPTYTMKHGEYLLTRLLDSLWIQSYQNFEIVITDNSDDDKIEKICKYYGGGIRYFRNPIKGMAQNTNAAIRHSQGNLVKIIYMDDYLAHKDALKKIVYYFDGNWLVSACTHINIGQSFTHSDHYPAYSKRIERGINTIGSPSVLTIKNENPLMFDEAMTWLLDVDYYRRMHEKYGDPILLRDVNVIIGLHDGQATNILPDEVKQNEYYYLNKKYEHI